MRQRIETATRHADAMATEGLPITRDDLGFDDIDDVDQALELYRHAVRQGQAATAVKKAAGETLALLLGYGGAACYGNQIVRYRRGWKERCIDPDIAMEAIVQMQTDGTIDIRQWFNATQAKKSAMPEAFRDTFFEKVDDPEPKLTDMPIDRAPKFLQSMVDGDVKVGG